MQSVTAALVAATFMLSPAALAAESLSPIGEWEVTTGESRYRVDYCGAGSELCATLTWLRDDARTEENLALLNQRVVSGAVPAAGNSWSGDVTYDGETYSGTVEMVDDDAMRVQSCAGLICRSFLLHRI